MGVFGIIYTIRDQKNKTSTTEMQVPDSISISAAIDFGQAMAVLINDMISGVISRIGIAASVDLPGGLRTTPDAASDVEEGAKFQFSTVGGFKTGLRLPTFLESLISAGSDAVDTTDTDVAAFVAAMTDGLPNLGDGNDESVPPVDKREDNVNALTFAREQFQSSRG